MPFLRRSTAPGEVSDDVIRHYIHHQDHNIRLVAANKVLGINSGYIGWRAPGGEVRPELVMEFLKSDPRVRRAMFAAIDNVLRARGQDRAAHPRDLRPRGPGGEGPRRIVVGQGRRAARDRPCPADQVVPHVDLLLALPQARGMVAAERRAARADPGGGGRALLPEGAAARSANWSGPTSASALTLGLLPGIRAKIKEAGPAVQQLAAETLKETYTGYAGVKTAPGGQDISSPRRPPGMHRRLAGRRAGRTRCALRDRPRALSRTRSCPTRSSSCSADPEAFGPKLKKAITPIIMDELIPEFVGRNRRSSCSWPPSKCSTPDRGGKGDQSTSWWPSTTGPAATTTTGTCSSTCARPSGPTIPSTRFAAEQVPLDQLVTRYREVTLPEGMENWFDRPSIRPRPAGRPASRPSASTTARFPTGLLSKCSDACVGPVCYGAPGATPCGRRKSC